MYTSELKSIYRDACKLQRMDPDPDAFKAWKSVLGRLDERDVRAALEAWWASERGSFLPKPADLKPEADRLGRIRWAAETVDYCEECNLGWRGELVDGKITKVPCECRARVRKAIAERDERKGDGGRNVPR
jgi:hypothetical protein